MQQNSQRMYNSVHFEEYLDNGIRDVYLHDIQALLSDFSAEPLPTVSRKKIHPSLVEQTYTPTSQEQERKNDWYMSHMVRVCSDMLGEEIIDVSFPGGIYRKSCRMHLRHGRTLIATNRQGPGRAVLEERVMSKLAQESIPVPDIYAFNGIILLQEDLQGEVADKAIERSDETSFSHIARKALSSLAEVHQSAEKKGLDHAVPMIGYDPDWLISFLDRTAVLGGYLNIHAPAIAADKLYDLLVLLKPRFVKWDARPGNAVLSPEGAIRWFDWEHCGVRNRLDDVAWFLCDDKVPDFPDSEDNVINDHLADFADGRSVDHAHDYLRLYGVLHMSARIGRMLNQKGNNSWAQLDHFLGREQEGTSLKHAQRLCQRASRWSSHMPTIAHLQPWFLDVSEKLGQI